MKKLALLFLFFLYCSNILLGQNFSINFEESDFESALTKASQQQKLIFIDAYTSWCRPCKLMDKNVFTHQEAGRFYNERFINLKIDMEKGEGIGLAKRYQVQAFPTFLFLNHKGEIIHRSAGYKTPEEFIEMGSDALSPEKRLFYLQRKFEQDPTDTQTAFSYFQAKSRAGASVEEEIDHYFNNLPEKKITDQTNWKIIKKFGVRPKSAMLSKILEYRQNLNSHYTKDSVDALILSGYKDAIFSAFFAGEQGQMKSLKYEMLSLDLNQSQCILLEIEITQAELAKKTDRYLSMIANYISNCPVTEAGTLHYHAWKVLSETKDPKLLTQATSWAKKAAETHPKYIYLNTYARLLFSTDRKGEAESILIKAIEQGRKELKDTEYSEELLREITGKKVSGKIQMGYKIKKDKVIFFFDPKLYEKAISGETKMVIPLKEINIENVKITGDFNNWNQDHWVMNKTSKQSFVLEKELSDLNANQNSWEFQFVVNNKFLVIPPAKAKNRVKTTEEFNIHYHLQLRK
jgi:thioredoxin-related protein